MSSNSNINDLNPLDENIVWDPEADRPQNSFSLVDDGNYQVTFTQGRRSGGTEVKESAKGGEYVSAFVCATISNPGGKADGRKVFFSPSTRGFKDDKGRPQASDAHCIILDAGLDIPRVLTQTEFAQLLDTALMGEPHGNIGTRWEAQVKVDVGGREGYRTILAGQKKFPKNPDGTYNPKLTAANTADLELSYKEKGEKVSYTIPEGEEIEADVRVFVRFPEPAAQRAS